MKASSFNAINESNSIFTGNKTIMGDVNPLQWTKSNNKCETRPYITCNLFAEVSSIVDGRCISLLGTITGVN